MANKKRSFRQLTKQMSAKDFENLCKKIAGDYAKYNWHFSRDYFTNLYNISDSCFSKILEYAIVTSLISEEDFYKIMEKAILNQKAHNSSVRASTQIYYKQMLKKRYEYSLFMFFDWQVREMAETFANHPEVSKQELADALEIEVTVLDLAIKRAIIENFVSDETFYEIRKRSLENLSGEEFQKAIKVFDAMWKLRQTKGDIFLS